MTNKKGRHVEADRIERQAEYLRVKKRAKKEGKMKLRTLKKEKK